MDITNIHVCLLIRNFFGDKQEELTVNKILSFYKKSPDDINYRNFTRDRVPKCKTQAVEKLFNSLGIFFNLFSKNYSEAELKDLAEQHNMVVKDMQKHIDSMKQHHK